MATRKKSETTVKTDEEVITETVDKEKELLRKKVSQQETEIDKLKAQMELLLSSMKSEQKEKKTPKKNIKFINMTTGGFNIHGTRFYHLDKQFDFQVFSENEARTIVNNMPHAVANGELYIADHDFVEECELDYIYENLIDDVTLKNLLSKDARDICEVYKNASESQKRIIVDMVVEKQINNEQIDANILISLGKLCGMDLIGIEPLDKEG